MMGWLKYKFKKWYLIIYNIITESLGRFEIAKRKDTGRREEDATKKKSENRRGDTHLKVRQRLERCGHRQRNA